MVSMREMIDANSAVFRKLAWFSLAMVILPIATFFALDRLLRAHASKTLWSGLAAVTMAYFVCICYCVSAYSEDRDVAVVNDANRASRAKED